MKRIKKSLRISIIALLLFGVSFSVSDSFAYWSTGVTGSNDVATAQVTTSSWNQIYAWSSTATYTIGDLVYHNGSTWISTKSGTNTKEPSLSRPGNLWWEPYTG